MSGKKKTFYISDEAELVLEQLANANAMSASSMLCQLILEKGISEKIVEEKNVEGLKGNAKNEYHPINFSAKLEEQEEKMDDIINKLDNLDVRVQEWQRLFIGNGNKNNLCIVVKNDTDDK